MAGIVHNYQGRDAVHRIDNFLSWFLQSPASAALWMGLGIGATGIVLALPRLRSYVQ
jgi:hypothetical protein